MDNRVYNYDYREIDPHENAETIRGLFTDIFKQNVTPEQYAWKYLAIKPAPMRTWAAYVKGTDIIVGAYSVFKLIFEENGRNVVVYQGSDGMVVKEHRRYGVFYGLIKTVIEVLENEGADLHIAYCNEKSLPAMFKALITAKQIPTGRVFFYPIGTSNVLKALPVNVVLRKVVGLVTTPLVRLLRLARCSFFTTDVELRQATSFDFVDRLNKDTMAKHHTLLPPRNANFFEWKIGNAPEFIKDRVLIFEAVRQDESVGYCFLSKDDRRNVIIIQSIFVTKEETLRGILLKVLEYALKTGADGILTNCSSGFLHEEYRKFGFVRGNQVRGVYYDFTNRYKDEINGPAFCLQEPIDRDLYDF